MCHSSTANPDTAADLWIGAQGSPNDDIRWASSNQLLNFSDWWPNDPNYGVQDERCVILWRYRVDFGPIRGVMINTGPCVNIRSINTTDLCQGRSQTMLNLEP